MCKYNIQFSKYYDGGVRMIEIIIYGMITAFAALMYMFISDLYRDRQWRKNNPDEHNIMERKIKDDFSEQTVRDKRSYDGWCDFVYVVYML